jgi:hypothetical protein
MLESNEKVQYWIDFAEYDLKTAKIITARIIHEFPLASFPHPPFPLSHAARGRGGVSIRAPGTDPSPTYGRGDQGVREHNVKQRVPCALKKFVNNSGYIMA